MTACRDPTEARYAAAALAWARFYMPSVLERLCPWPSPPSAPPLLPLCGDDKPCHDAHIVEEMSALGWLLRLFYRRVHDVACGESRDALLVAVLLSADSLERFRVEAQPQDRETVEYELEAAMRRHASSVDASAPPTAPLSLSSSSRHTCAACTSSPPPPPPPPPQSRAHCIIIAPDDNPPCLLISEQQLRAKKKRWTSSLRAKASKGNSGTDAFAASLYKFAMGVLEAPGSVVASGVGCFVLDWARRNLESIFRFVPFELKEETVKFDILSINLLLCIFFKQVHHYACGRARRLFAAGCSLALATIDHVLRRTEANMRDNTLRVMLAAEQIKDASCKVWVEAKAAAMRPTAAAVNRQATLAEQTFVPFYLCDVCRKLACNAFSHGWQTRRRNQQPTATWEEAAADFFSTKRQWTAALASGANEQPGMSHRHRHTNQRVEHRRRRSDGRGGLGVPFKFSGIDEFSSSLMSAWCCCRASAPKTSAVCEHLALTSKRRPDKHLPVLQAIPELSECDSESGNSSSDDSDISPLSRYCRTVKSLRKCTEELRRLFEDQYD